MHLVKYILVVISSLWVVLASAGDTNTAKMRAVDSIYQSLSQFQKLQKMVWVQSDENTSPAANNPFGAYYYSQPIDVFFNSYGSAISVQLDERMNPLPNLLFGLPDAYTLAALTQRELLHNYLRYLKKSCLERGVDYLVLPSTNNLQIASLNQSIHDYDPDFFIQSQGVTRENFKRKKDLAQALEDHKIWIVPAARTEEADEKLRKGIKKIHIPSLESQVKNNIQANMRRNQTLGTLRIPGQLHASILKHAVVPLQKQPGLFPLRTDTICLVTNQPYGYLANNLRRYAYVKTTFSDIIKSQAILLIDNDTDVPDALFFSKSAVFFIGEINHALKWKEKIDGGLVYTTKNEAYEYLIPQQLFGVITTDGQLADNLAQFSQFQSIPLAGQQILGYAPPDMVGLDLDARDEIYNIVQEAIQSGSTPGCQLAIAVDGSLVLEESFGYLTYDSLIPVDKNTLFDIASVTKVAGTLLVMMKLYDEGLLDLDATLCQYLPDYCGSNKQDITIKALLSHNAGLVSYVPFWQKTLSSDLLDYFVYESPEDEQVDKRSYGLKPSPLLMDSLKNWLVQSPVFSTDSIPAYRYSDLGFMILQLVVESITQQDYETYLMDNFIRPLGLTRLTFNPKDHGFDLYEIAPTEFDHYFRDELIWGDVHDRNAAVFGGVAGHAGLFSNAHELTVLMQTILQQGHYGGHDFFSPATVNYFNQRHFPNNRRALGWDKSDDLTSNASNLVGNDSFGHTGFTGTMVWADPKYNLVFIFLSNRVYPNVNNYGLIQRNIRTRIQDVVYKALMAHWSNE